MDCDNPHHLRQSNPQKNHRPTIIYLLYPLKYPHFFIVKAYVYWILQWLNHPPAEKPILPPHPQWDPATGCPLGQRLEAIPDQRPEPLGEARSPAAVKDQTWQVATRSGPGRIRGMMAKGSWTSNILFFSVWLYHVISHLLICHCVVGSISSIPLYPTKYSTSQWDITKRKWWSIGYVHVYIYIYMGWVMGYKTNN